MKYFQFQINLKFIKHNISYQITSNKKQSREEKKTS